MHSVRANHDAKKLKVFFFFKCVPISFYNGLNDACRLSKMNPFVFFMHRLAADSLGNLDLLVTVIVMQGLGLSCACVYCFFMLPSQKVFKSLRD